MSVSRLLPAFIVIACSADPIPAGRYLITTGQENDTFTLSPAPVAFESTKIDLNGTKTSIETSDKPIDTIDVGYTDTFFFQLQGTDADGQRRVQAMSYYVSATDLAGFDVKLFAGRTDTFCRPPENLTTALGDHPPVGLFWGQILWVTGTSTNNKILGDGYNLFGWGHINQPSFLGSSTCPQSPCEFKSIANYGGQFALAIGADWAISIDVQSEAITTPAVPNDLGVWSNVSGGRTLNAPTGAAFIVGPTRTSAETNKVLQLAIDGNPYTRLLSVPRQGAAAVYVKDHGLVVSGGDASGTAGNPGVEFMAEAGAEFTGVPYPADAVVGAALVPEIADGTLVWRVGGKNADGTPAPTLVYDIKCTSDCVPATKPDFDLDVMNAQGFKIGQTRIVAGETSDGTMVAWRLTDSGPVAIPLREPRKNASIYSLPNGFLALIGGTLLGDGTPAKSIELVAY